MNKIVFCRDFLHKALHLIETDRVHRITAEVYVVEGYHVKTRKSYPRGYLVKLNDGKWACSCPGYATYGFCTHALAVLIVEAYENAQNSQLSTFRNSSERVVGHG